MNKPLPRYPIFIPSRQRADACLTADGLRQDAVPFTIVCAPREVDSYSQMYGEHAVIALPHDHCDIVQARNWIKDYATIQGHKRHWQLDDNMRHFYRRYHGRRLYCDASIALRVAEDFTDRYTNIALTGLAYAMMVPDQQNHPSIQVNCHVYSCTLVNNAITQRWRGPYNDDTDFCLQVLAAEWCTVLINAFLVDKAVTMSMKGGMTDANANSYQGDGRLHMARTLERRWPGVVTTKRRFNRPQHTVIDGWKRFDTPLQLKEGLSLAELAKTSNEYDMTLAQVGDTVKSQPMQDMLDDWTATHGPQNETHPRR